LIVFIFTGRWQYSKESSVLGRDHNFNGLVSAPHGCDAGIFHHNHHHHHHHHLALMELGHSLTLSGVTHPEVSSVVSPGSFCFWSAFIVILCNSLHAFVKNNTINSVKDSDLLRQAI
jgi:hypothetical protein